MRLLLITVAAMLVGCASPPVPVAKSTADPTTEAWYAPAVQELAAINREADSLLKSGEADEAAARITRGQPLQKRILSVPQPTLAAMEAASDLDDLYGRMLFRNRHYGWARLEFQKNVVRWKNWKPETPETTRRLNQARSAIAECDRRLEE